MRADARASRKLKLAQKAKFTQKKPVLNKRSYSYQSAGRPASSPYSQVPQLIQHVVPASQPATSYRYQYPGPGGSSVAGFGSCFECGMVGHLRKYCPKLMLTKPTSASNK